MADLNPGPAWIRDDLPQPIASAWAAALRSLATPGGPDPQRFVAAVEAALRYMTGIQLAALRAAEAPLPDLCRGGAFRQPTLGFWFLLAKNIRDAPPNLLTPEIGDWPDPFIDGTLAEFINLRGRLRLEPGAQPDPEQRRATARLIPLAVEVMRSLAPLRAPRLLMVVAQRAVDAFRHDGAVQTFHGPGLQPAAERARWRGQLVNFAMVLAPPAGGNRREAIHLAPFVSFERLRDAQADAVCLWRGMNDRGQVLLGEDPEDPRGWRKLEPGTLLWPFQLDEPGQGSREPAFPHHLRHLEVAPGPLEPPTMRGTPVVRADGLPSFEPLSVLDSSHPAPVAAPARPLRVAAIVAVTALALAATAWFAMRIATDLEAPQAAASAPAVPEAPGRAASETESDKGPPGPGTSTETTALPPGVWMLEARPLVLQAPATSARRPPAAPPVTRYRLQLQRMADAAALEGTLTREPPLPPPARAGRLPKAGTTPASGPVVPVGPSVGGSWVLRAGLKGEGRNELIEVGLRVRRTPTGLVGLWRHEGAERGRGALAGALVGALEGSALPDVGACLAGCLGACADLAPAADPASEACLDRCLGPDACAPPERP
jgi:hypothetical protein